MICPMVAKQMRAYYGDGMGHPPIKEPEFQCAKEFCEWWVKEQGCCSEVAKVRMLQKIHEDLYALSIKDETSRTGKEEAESWYDYIYDEGIKVGRKGVVETAESYIRTLTELIVALKNLNITPTEASIKNVDETWEFWQAKKKEWGLNDD